MTEVLIEQKGVDRRTAPFYGNVVVFSNEVHCVQVTRDNRRHVIFEVNTEKCNNTEFFQSIYKELDSVEIMQCAWNYFLARDVSEWDFRKIPETKLMKRLQRCSESVAMKFARWFFKLRSSGDITITENELYMYFCDFCTETGIPNKRDAMFVASGFESILPCSQRDNTYFFARADIQKFLTTHGLRNSDSWV